MKNLMTFEAFAGRPLSVAPAHLFMNYYHCNGCDALYQSPRRLGKCGYCDKPVKSTTVESWEKELKRRLDTDEWNNYLKSKEEFKDEIIHLSDLDQDNDKEYYEH